MTLSRTLTDSHSSEDGIITVTKEDLEGLLREQGVELQLAPPADERRGPKKHIHDSEFTETSWVVIGVQGEEVDPWKDADYEIGHTKIEGYALLYPQPSIEPLRIMAETRVKEMQARYGGGGAAAAAA